MWAGPSLPYTPPPRVLPFDAPYSPQFTSSPIPTGPGFLTWSRLGLQLPDVPPPSPPPPHRTRSPPCSPSVVCLCPAMEDLGEWGPSSLVPSSSLFSGPTSLYWTPSRSLHLPIPVSSLLTPGLSARAFFPTPCPPSCLSLPAFPEPAAPSLLPSLCSSITGCGQMSKEVRLLWAPGLRGSGMVEVKGILGPGTGKVDRKGGFDIKFWRRAVGFGEGKY